MLETFSRVLQTEFSDLSSRSLRRFPRFVCFLTLNLTLRRLSAYLFFSRTVATITWYTGADLNLPSCADKSGWTPTDESLISAVTIKWGNGKPACGTFLQLKSRKSLCSQPVAPLFEWRLTHFSLDQPRITNQSSFALSIAAKVVGMRTWICPLALSRPFTHLTSAKWTRSKFRLYPDLPSKNGRLNSPSSTVLKSCRSRLHSFFSSLPGSTSSSSLPSKVSHNSRSLVALVLFPRRLSSPSVV